MAILYVAVSRVILQVADIPVGALWLPALWSRDAAFAYVQTVPRLGQLGHGIADVKIYAMQGQTDRARAALREAVDQGCILMNDFDEGLAPLYDEPEYQTMMDQIKAKQAEQLKRLRALDNSSE
ncbi:MAG: hypothetical protein WBO47_12530 [Gammaproteobacteria bacterium]